jgi:hypothetical protein
VLVFRKNSVIGGCTSAFSRKPLFSLAGKSACARSYIDQPPRSPPFPHQPSHFVWRLNTEGI